MKIVYLGRSFHISFIIVMLGLHLGTIRRNQDPIRETQTGPISYKAKMEEIKEGVKGAPAPSMLFYGFERFLVDPPYGQDRETRYELKYDQIDGGQQLDTDMLSEATGDEELWWKEEAEKSTSETDEVMWWTEGEEGRPSSTNNQELT